LGEAGGWYKIESGYISAEYVVLVDAETAASAGLGQEIADYALQFVGYPYVYGGSSPKGFDCSGFTKYIYSQFGYSINRTASNQMDHGVSVSMSELEPGDLVFFKKSGTGSKRASHVGIYIGGNQFVHASTSRVGVIVSNMSDAYYTTGFVGGRRLV
ncbi:MAG: C40 family peptidase, partial [Oscillospiraceae bacterium]|nr:C40 family peptidase [Oscillospiraceae bacterium]